MTTHGIPINALADRMSISLTLLLTAGAQMGPISDVGKLNVVEWYSLYSCMMLLFQGVLVWALSDLYWYRCSSDDENYMVFEDSTEETYADWWTGQQENITSAVFMDVTCQQIHIADRVILAIEFFIFIVKNMISIKV